MELGLFFIVSIYLIALVILLVKFDVYLEHYKPNDTQKDSLTVCNEKHNICTQKIISESEISKVEEILKHPSCTQSMRSRIMGYYNPQTKSFFMRFADLYDFQLELLDKQNKNK